MDGLGRMTTTLVSWFLLLTVHMGLLVYMSPKKGWAYSQGGPNVEVEHCQLYVFLQVL